MAYIVVHFMCRTNCIVVCLKDKSFIEQLFELLNTETDKKICSHVSFSTQMSVLLGVEKLQNKLYNCWFKGLLNKFSFAYTCSHNS